MQPIKIQLTPLGNTKGYFSLKEEVYVHKYKNAWLIKFNGIYFERKNVICNLFRLFPTEILKQKSG